MRTLSPIRRAGLRQRCERGSMLLELLIAIVVLAVGMGGLIPLLVSSMYSNNRSSTDTTSTMLAEHVLEQITSLSANSNNTLTITDCAGTGWTIATQGAAKGSGTGSNGGNGANLTSGGIIDWTQDYSSVPADYKMRYVSCGAGGRQAIYDVRWNVISMNYLTGTNYTRMVIISARPSGSPTVGGLRYVVPINLRTIGGAF
jgi:type II secretory pathway pseudopilin PulG